jgi:hypothetical protein
LRLTKDLPLKNRSATNKIDFLGQSIVNWKSVTVLKSMTKILASAVLLVVLIGCQPRLQSNVIPWEQAISESEPTADATLTTKPEPEKSQQDLPEIPPDKPTTESEQPKPEQTPKDTPAEKPEPEQLIAQPEQETQPKLQAKPEEKPKQQQDKETSKQDQAEKEVQKDNEEDHDPIKADKPRKPAFYEKCNFIFTIYVDEKGLVDYDTLRRKRLDLIAAAKEFDNIQPFDMMSWSQNEKLALWLNAYNIFTLKLIVDNYPIQPRWYMITYPDDSIMQIPGAWTKNYFEVMGIEYTLREIEREILLQRFKDPRICFALSYATLGGAILRNEVYLPEKLDKQLDDQVKKYLSTPRGFRIDHVNKVIYLSNIFSSYKSIFIEKYGDIKKYRWRKPHERACLNFISEYVDPDNIKYFESDRYSIKFLQYDWQLNEQPRK